MAVEKTGPGRKCFLSAALSGYPAGCFLFLRLVLLCSIVRAEGGPAEVLLGREEQLEEEGGDQSLRDPASACRVRWAWGCPRLQPGSEKASVGLRPVLCTPGLRGTRETLGGPRPCFGDSLLSGGGVRLRAQASSPQTKGGKGAGVGQC